METIGNPMRREQILNEWCRDMTPKNSKLITFDERTGIELHPQISTNGVLAPEVSVVMFNYPDLCVEVHLAMAADGLIYSSHTYIRGEIGESAYPCMDTTGTESVIEAINYELVQVILDMFNQNQELIKNFQ